MREEDRGQSRAGHDDSREVVAAPRRRPEREADGDTEPLRVAVIIGSTREGRVGEKVGEWFLRLAGDRDDVEPRAVDLVDFDFPARYPDHTTAHIRDFVHEVDRADAFVVVTPEYNRSFPASLKQAIDYAYDEWHTKPVAFVSYGHGSRGLYAVEHLRSVFTELHTVTLRNGVAVNLLDDVLDERAGAASLMLDQLHWWGTALRDARARRPYAS